MLDYLTEEVLELQPAQVRTFLLETSVLERLSGQLCDVVTGRGDGQRQLEEIERANLFLVPLDEVRGWWRYHHLFADLLRARLAQEQPERVPQLHQAATAWFEERGLVEEAIHHALAAGAADWAARLVEDHFARLLWRSEEVTVDRWLAALPPAVVSARPWLCLGMAARAGLAGRLGEVEPLLEAAERAHAGAGAPPATLAGVTTSLADDVLTMVAMLRANLARTYGDAGPATRLAERSVASLAGDNEIAHAMIYWAQARPRPTGWAGGWRRPSAPSPWSSRRTGRLGCPSRLPPSTTSWAPRPTMRPGASSCAGSSTTPGRWQPDSRPWPGSSTHKATRTAPGRPWRRPSRSCPTRGWSSCSPSADTGGTAGPGLGTDRRRRPLGPRPRAGKQR